MQKKQNHVNLCLVCMLSKLQFLSNNVKYAGFHFDDILWVQGPSATIFDAIITKNYFICIYTSIDIPVFFGSFHDFCTTRVH